MPVASISKEKAAPGKEEVVVKSVQRWLGNPISKILLRFVCGRSKRGGNRLDIAIRRYIGEDIPVDFQDRLASFVVKLVMGHGSNVFGYSGENLKEHLKDPVIRRGMVNVLEGIARYGARRPFTSVAPFLVVWNYTKLCNLRCEHCYEGAGPEAMKDELTTEEAKRVIDEFEDAGVVAIAFSGGEPLLRKDIFEVAGYARNKGFFTSVATNGTVITREVARKMKDVFGYAEISLDGFEEAHDKFRGVPGAWKRTCEGIKNSVAEGIDTCVALTATRYNLHEIPKLVDFAEQELGVKRVIMFNYVPVGRGKDIIDQDPSPQERHELLKYLYTRMIDSNCKLICYSTAPQYSMVSWEFAYGTYSASGIVSTHFTSEGAMRALQGRTKSLADFLGGCGAGRLYCGLEPNGDITPCVFMPIKLGNIRRDRLRDVWHSSEVLWKLRDRDALEGCGACEHRYICGGCRARAYAYYGDVQAPDPGCIHNVRYWRELKMKVRGEQPRVPVELKAAA
ncbi:MAG: radical SAM protein [Candidatus Hodarchaeaceae archaeon]|nr:radical SAM protein [Candidatus Hodarchaeaceae archaeon]